MTRGLPLAKNYFSDSFLNPEQIVDTLDLSYLEDVLTKADALNILKASQHTRVQRESIIQQGYPGYDTSIGWFNYSEGVYKTPQEVGSSSDLVHTRV
jgi:L-fuconate dehydratase